MGRHLGYLQDLREDGAGGEQSNRIEGYGGSLPPIPSIPQLRRRGEMTQTVGVSEPSSGTGQQRSGVRQNCLACHAGHAPGCIDCKVAQATASRQHEWRDTKHAARDMSDVSQAWSMTSALHNLLLYM